MTQEGRPPPANKTRSLLWERWAVALGGEGRGWSVDQGHQWEGAGGRTVCGPRLHAWNMWLGLIGLCLQNID